MSSTLAPPENEGRFASQRRAVGPAGAGAGLWAAPGTPAQRANGRCPGGEAGSHDDRGNSIDARLQADRSWLSVPDRRERSGGSALLPDPVPEELDPATRTRSNGKRGDLTDFHRLTGVPGWVK